MSFPTEPAFVVHAQGWDAGLLRHPMAQFLHAHEHVFDAKDIEGCKPFYTPDITFIKGNGQAFSGDAAVTAMFAEYALFAEYFHEPSFGVFTENPDGGYRLFGYAKMFVDLPGAVDKKHIDLAGRAWECQAHGAFLFDVVKDPEGPQGFRIKFFQLFSDPTAILGHAIKRGLIPVEALAA